MNVSVDMQRMTCKVVRTEGDPKFRDGGYAGGNAGNSRFLYHVKNALNEQGFDMIKKPMWKDGHMVDDRQQYLRSRKPYAEGSYLAITDPSWAIRGADTTFNEEGQVNLRVHLL